MVHNMMSEKIPHGVNGCYYGSGSKDDIMPKILYNM